MPANPVVPETLSESKVVLRRVSISDAEGLHKIFSNPDATQFWNLPEARVIDDTLAWIEKSKNLVTAYHAAWSVIDRKTNDIIGVISYHDREPWQDRLQISHLFLPKYNKAVFLTDAINSLLNVCFVLLKSHRIESLLSPDDNISKQVFAKLGFRYEGTLRGKFRFRDTYRDVESFSLLADQWQNKAALKNRSRDGSTLHYRLPAHDPAAARHLESTQISSIFDSTKAQIPIGLAFPVYLAGDQLKGFSRNRSIVVRAPHKILKAIIEVADGLHTKEEIVAHVPANYDRQDVAALISGMEAQGILISSDHRIESQWDWVRNPPFYRRTVNPDLPSILARAASEKVSASVKSGVVFKPSKNMVATLLQKRTTTRSFSDSPLSDSEISKLLYCAYGVLDARKSWQGNKIARRTVPSAGGIYPLTLTWAQWRKTDNLGIGIYKINFGRNRTIGFELISTDVSQVFRTLVQPASAPDAHGILFISADFSLARPKYGNRAISFAMLEAGHVAQNVQLAAISLGKGVMEIGGLFEEQVKKLAQSPTCEPLIALVIGNIFLDKKIFPNTDVADIEFDWIERTGSYQPPFHIARTRLKYGKRTTDWCWGKSPDSLIAVKKSVGEAIERLSCQYPHNLKWARPRDLTKFVNPHRLVSYASSRYKEGGFPFAKFDAGKLYPWVNAKEYGSGKIIPILADHVFFQDSIGAENKKYTYPYTSASTSGVASFPTLEGAIERAVLELIERHMFMLVWLGRIACPHIAPSSLPSGIQERLSALNSHGWNVQILLIGTEPVVTLLVFAQNSKLGMTRVSAGSGFNSEDTLYHALQEVEASIPFVSDRAPIIRKSIDLKTLKSPHDHGDLYLQRKYFRKADWLVNGRSEIAFGKISSRCQSMDEIFSFFARKSLKSYIVDITPTINYSSKTMNNIKVVRVLIEGLIPISFGFGLEPQLTDLTFNIERTKIRKMQGFPHPFF